MTDYKSQKEAFVSDNLGSSIYSILSISSTALTSYALYASFSGRYRRHPILDYLTAVLPLLLSITISSTTPILLNVLLLLIIGIHKYFISSPSRQVGINGHGHPPQPETKSPGSWLEESDSDEEPTLPPRNLTPTTIRFSTDTTTSTSTSSLSPFPSPLPDSGRLSVEVPSSSRPPWRRRHSPTPSTHTHTAIDILSTPRVDDSNFDSHGSGSRGTEETRKAPFLSVYRAHMMIMTIHAILAVDFPVFPRWLGKCEDFGTSLMDVGVGSFVFSLGLVSARSFSRSGSADGLVHSLGKAMKKAAPVLFLGLIRVIMVKGTEYPEHVTEYGVHWNFFFTLGILPIFGTLLSPVREKYMRWSIMGILISICHQFSLAEFGLQAWVMSPLRQGVIGMNKEGLVSLPGYIAIYFLGLSTGGHILRPFPSITQGQDHTQSPSQMKATVKRQIEKRRSELCLVLFSYSASWWTFLGVSSLMGMEVSRRLANLPYVLWTAGYNTTFLLGYLILEISLFNYDSENTVPPLLEAINANGLVVFLIANLMTGLVNLSMKTMYAGTGISMVVLLGYSLFVCFVAWVLRGFRLKI